jgi:hypothetical protein
MFALFSISTGFERYLYTFRTLFLFYGGFLLILLDIWGLLSVISFIWVVYDALTQNRSLNDMMKIMWIVIALIFGTLGAVLYFFIGRKK